MPYEDISELPSNIKEYSERIQRQYMHVFNSVYEKVLDETGSKKEAETRAIKAGRAVLKRRFQGRRSMEKNTREDYMQYLIDSFIGNLKE